MLEPIQDLSDEISGVRASGRVSQEDYVRVLEPILQEAKRTGRHVRLLYEFGPHFQGLTATALWEDARVFARFLPQLERCAVVSDIRWVQRVSRAAAKIAPLPLRVFESAQRDAALAWLNAPASSTSLACLLREDRGVLLVEPLRPLSAEDFAILGAAIDPWISEHGELEGMVVIAREFPGWESLGSFVRHVWFVRTHQKAVQRVALASDSGLADLVPAVLNRFVRPQIRHFPYGEIDRALAWAAYAHEDTSSHEDTRPPAAAPNTRAADGFGVEGRP
jgi:hypothetical protein